MATRYCHVYNLRIGQRKARENRQRRRHPPNLRSTNRPLLTGRAIVHPIAVRIEVLCEGITNKTKGLAQGFLSLIKCEGSTHATCFHSTIYARRKQAPISSKGGEAVKIRKFREAAGLTMKELAGKVGVSVWPPCPAGKVAWISLRRADFPFWRAPSTAPLTSSTAGTLLRRRAEAR